MRLSLSSFFFSLSSLFFKKIFEQTQQVHYLKSKHKIHPATAQKKKNNKNPTNAIQPINKGGGGGNFAT